MHTGVNLRTYHRSPLLSSFVPLSCRESDAARIALGSFECSFSTSDQWLDIGSVVGHRISGWTSDQFFDIGSVVRCRFVPWCHFVARCQSSVKRCTFSVRVSFFCRRNRASSAFWTKAFRVQGAGIGEFCFPGVRTKTAGMLALLWCG